MSTAEQWYNESMARIEAGENRAKRFAAYKKTKEYRDDVAYVMGRLAANPNKVSEAIGADGIQYPFNTNMAGRSDTERADIRAEIDRWEKAFYGAIGRAIITRDNATIGELINRHAFPYLEKMAEEIVEDRFQ